MYNNCLLIILLVILNMENVNLSIDIKGAQLMNNIILLMYSIWVKENYIQRSLVEPV